MNKQELIEKLIQADALVHTSLYESGGMVCLEALVNGCKLLGISQNGVRLIAKDHELYCKLIEPSSERVMGLYRIMMEAIHEKRAKEDCYEVKVDKSWLWASKALYYSKVYTESVASDVA